MIMDSSNKVIFLGFDGATWEIIKPLVNQGLLPAFKELLENGACTDLQSTLPSFSPQAWTSIFTGVSPAKHEILGFTRLRQNSYFLVPVSSKDRNWEPLWSILSRNNKKVVLLFIPFSYPPDKVNGVMTTGLGTPSNQSNFAYPADFQQEILKQFPEYKVTYSGEGLLLGEDKDRLFSQLLGFAEAEFKIVKTLLSSRQWDLFAAVFRLTDIVQHFFWQDKEAIFKAYACLDKFLADILASYKQKATIIICSDHGFGEVNTYIHGTAWLESLGLLKFKTAARFSRKASSAAQIARQLAYRLGIKEWQRKAQAKLKEGSLLSRLLLKLVAPSYYYLLNVDWAKTKAYLIPGSGGIINLNLVGREPEGIVEPSEASKVEQFIIKEALKLKDPETGDKVFKIASTCKAIYGKKPASRADIVLIESSKYQLVESYNNGNIFGPPIHKGYLKPSNHCQNGILGLYGRHIQTANFNNACVYDLTPTILQLFGLPISDEIDGKVLEEILAADVTKGSKLFSSQKFNLEKRRIKKIKAKLNRENK